MRNLKRALSLGLTAAMISGLMVMGSSAASYADVTSEDNVEAIDVLEAVGIMIGDENGNFNPDQNVTRNEMAVVMSNLMEYNVASYKDTSPFTDVPSWAEPYVAACYTNGITAGTSATTYGGSDTVTTAQAALMLMKALGYFQYASDFGGDWQLATVRQGNAIDLFVGVDSGVTQAMTRNDVAQLVLNTLESGTVKASTGGSITVGGVTINTDVKYDYVTSGETYAFAINDRNTNNDGDLVLGSIVELGEQLYMGDLRKDSGSDHFGRPSSIWEYKNDEIGTYPDDADYTYTDGISERDLYNRLGSNIMTGNNAYNWTVYYNGELLDIEKPSRSVNDDYSETATGTLTEVFVDNVDETVTVTMIDTFLAEVVRVQNTDNGVTVYVNYLSNPTNNTSRETSIELDSTDLQVDDKVLVTNYENGSRYSIDSIELAETVTGQVTAVRGRYTDDQGRYAVMDGQQYDYVGNTFAADLAETSLEDPTLNTENVLYLDNYNNMIAFEATERSVEYVYLDDAINALGGINTLATFADGRTETIFVDEVDGDEDPSCADMKSETTGQQPFVAGVYAYEQQGSAYQLLTLDRANTTNSWTARPDYDTVRNVGEYDYGTSPSTDAMAAGHQMTYSIKNGTNAIQANNEEVSTGNTSSLNAVPLTSSTIFVDVEGGVVYNGYNAVPTMRDIEFYVVYNRQDNADVVFITNGADNSTSDSYFFVTNYRPEATRVEDGTYYYQYDVMMDNNPDATITFQGTNRDSDNNEIQEDTLYKIETITPDGFVKSASRVDEFSLAYSTSNNVARYADGETLRVRNDANIAGCGDNNLAYTDGIPERIYGFNGDTQFVFIETEMKNGVLQARTTDIGSAGMINSLTDNLSGSNNVFVIAVDDEDARTPIATLVYIVEPYDGAVSDDTPTGTDKFSYGNFTFYIDAKASATSAIGVVNSSNGLNFQFTPNMGATATASYTFDYQVKDGDVVVTSVTGTTVAAASGVVSVTNVANGFIDSNRQYTIEITNVKATPYVVTGASNVSGIADTQVVVTPATMATGTTTTMSLAITGGVSVANQANVIFSVDNVKNVTVAPGVTALGNGRYQLSGATVSSAGAISAATVFNSVEPDETGAVTVTVEQIVDQSTNVVVNYVLASGSEDYATLSKTSDTVAVGATTLSSLPTLSFKNNVTEATVTISGGASDSTPNTGIATGGAISADSLTIPAAEMGKPITVTVTVTPTEYTKNLTLVGSGASGLTANAAGVKFDGDGKIMANEQLVTAGATNGTHYLIALEGTSLRAVLDGNSSSQIVATAGGEFTLTEDQLLSGTTLVFNVTKVLRFTAADQSTAGNFTGSTTGNYTYAVTLKSGTGVKINNDWYVASGAVLTLTVTHASGTISDTDTITPTVTTDTFSPASVTFTSSDANQSKTMDVTVSTDNQTLSVGGSNA